VNIPKGLFAEHVKRDHIAHLKTKNITTTFGKRMFQKNQTDNSIKKIKFIMYFIL